MFKIQTIKKVYVEITAALFALLYLYAAASKLLDFESFNRQLGLSPLLSAFAVYLAWAIPLLEIGIAVLLFVPNLRSAALFMAYGLMALFTAYIYIILNYSSFVPCSCGGVLEQMSWDQHLLFNVAFLVLGATAILVDSGSNPKNLQS